MHFPQCDLSITLCRCGLVSDIYIFHIVRNGKLRQGVVSECIGSWHPTGWHLLAFLSISLWDPCSEREDTHPTPSHSPYLHHHHHLHPSSAQGSPGGSVVPSALRSSPGGRQKVISLKMKCCSMDQVLGHSVASWWHCLGRWWNL